MYKCTVLRYMGHQGLNQGFLDLRSNALPFSYISSKMVANNTA